MSKFEFSGLIATAFTPFHDDADRSLNVLAIPDIAENFKKSHFQCVLINGTYGQGMSMTVDERLKVAETWSSTLKSMKSFKIQLMIQIGGTNMPDVLRLARHAQNIKADALLCLPEIYYKPRNIDELIDYLKIVGAAAPETPIFYYHSPAATGVALPMDELFVKVKDKLPTFAGVKFASPNMDDLSRAQRIAGDRYKIIVASNHNLPSYVEMGIDTFMPTSINIDPTSVAKIYESSVNGRRREAQKAQRIWSDWIDEIAALNDGNAAPPMKAIAARLTNIQLGPPRRPLRSFETGEGREKISAFLNKINF